MGGLIPKVLCFKWFSTSRCKYQEIKAEILNSCLIFISTPSVLCIAKTKELALLFQYFWGELCIS